MTKVDLVHAEITDAVIGAAIAVHRALGLLINFNVTASETESSAEFSDYSSPSFRGPPW